MKLLLRALALAGLCAAATAEQEPAARRIEAHVTAVAGEGVYLDRGRDAHVQVGDVVYLLPDGRQRIRATVDSVSRSGARAALERPEEVSVGDRALVLVPAERFAADEAAEDAPAAALPLAAAPPGADGQKPVLPAAPAPQDAEPPPVPEHPPWTQPPVEWQEGTPLLAPPAALTADDRPAKLSGRVYLGIFDSWDDANESRHYLLGRLGAAGLLENPFGQGGAVEFRGEAFQRTTDFEFGGDEDLSDLRLDRLSYSVGGTRDAPVFFEVGRFLQNAFPEFQILDGAEVHYRASGGNRWGVSAGGMPVPDATLSLEDDTQLAAFFAHDGFEDTALAWRLGYQKTWHDGRPDRDLVVADANWTPTERAWLHGTAWVDFYNSSDTIKQSGAQLTELRLGANWRLGDDSGLHADFAHLRWPEILRIEFPPVPPVQTALADVNRFDVGGWTGLTDHIRLRARLDTWSDEVQDGVGGEATVAWRDLLWDGGEVNATLFKNDGAYNSVEGGRLGATYASPSGFVSGSWEAFNSRQNDFFGNQDELLQQALRLSWDTALGKWDLSLSAERRFGDQLSAYTIGVLLQRRF